MRASNPSFEGLLVALEEARRLTLDLVELANDDELRHAFHPDFSPIGWHLGHIAMFEELWVLQHAHGEEPSRPMESRFFDPALTPKENRGDLPSRGWLLSHAAEVRRRTVEALAFDASRNADRPGAFSGARSELSRDLFVYRLILDHELQHAETIAVVLRQRRRSRREAAADRFGLPVSAPPCPERPPLRFEEAEVIVGNADPLVGYDNERPPATIRLPAFELDARPVTNGDWLQFVKDGGYARRELWCDDGWAFRSAARIDRPFYWDRAGSDFVLRAFAGDVPLPLSHPVEGVSAWEADAFARWSEKRLPSEAEWEHAARTLSGAESAFGMRVGGTWPVSSGADLLGNVWEWTADAFAPYPGFTADPYPEYSQLWFDGAHRVLRGGSWATHRRHLRPSFRNWYPPHSRAIFSGLRCARSI